MSISLIVEQYNQFQHAFGQGEIQDYEKIINALFIPNFKKIANGLELVTERTQLLSQLITVRDFAGKWTIQSQYCIPAQDSTKCTIRYFLHSEKAGSFDVMAMISVLNNQLESINEVYYQRAENSL